MFHEQKGKALFPHRQQHVNELLGFLRVQTGHRLVKQNERRARHSRPGDFHKPLRSVRQRARPLPGEMGQSDLLQAGKRLFLRLLFFSPRKRQPKAGAEDSARQPCMKADHHIFQHRHIRKQLQVLKRPRHSQHRQLVRLFAVDHAPLKADGAASRRNHAANHIEQCRFPRPVRPDHGNHLPFGDAERDVLHRLHAAK
ncbi:hypothetical protein LR69_01143 [Geobacillus sp. BCO2]|nr:hypothetical protein LR69_01143 [Geobacillus sp. BCO2]